MWQQRALRNAFAFRCGFNQATAATKIINRWASLAVLRNLYASSTLHVARRWDPAEDEKLLELRSRGYESKEIATRLDGRTASSVVMRIHRLLNHDPTIARRTRKPISKFEREQLLTLRENGRSWNEIMESLPGHSLHTLQQHCARMGSRASSVKHGPFNEAEDLKLVELRESSSLTWKEVGSRLNRNEQSVAARYRRIRVSPSARQPRRPNGLNDDDEVKIRKMRESGFTFAQIAAALGRNGSTIYRAYHSWAIRQGPRLPFTEADDTYILSAMAEGTAAQNIGARMRPKRTEQSVSARHRHLKDMERLGRKLVYVAKSLDSHDTKA